MEFDEISLSKTRAENRKKFYEKLCAMKYKCLLYVMFMLICITYMATNIITEKMKDHMLQEISSNQSDSLRQLYSLLQQYIIKKASGGEEK